MNNDFKIWRELEINPTKDTSQIRAAYKELITKYHPEEYPEKAGRLNQAYREAMAWARSNRSAAEKVTEVDPSPESYYREAGNQDESEKPLSEAERIGKFVEEVVLQEKLVHERLLADTSDRLNKICRPKHHQIHKEWQAFLENPNTKEAFLSSDFATMFANRIEKLRFWSNTVKMISRWLSHNVPYDYYPQDFLLYTNLKDIDERETKKEKKLITDCVVLTVFLSLCFVYYLIFGTSKTPSTNEIAQQINEKYKLETSVSEVDYDMKYNYIRYYKTDGKSLYYQADAKLPDGTEFTFHITWDKKTDTYTDDFEYELVRVYVDMLGIDIWEDTIGTDIALKIDEPLNEYAHRLKELIDHLVKTEYVQAGNTVVFVIRPDYLTIGQFPVTINKDTIADERNLIELLEEALETAKTVLPNN